MRKYYCRRCKKLIKEEYTVLTAKGAELKAQGKSVPKSEILHKTDYRANERDCDYITAPDTLPGTGIICPDCYNPETDIVIWGVHKK